MPHKKSKKELDNQTIIILTIITIIISLLGYSLNGIISHNPQQNSITLGFDWNDLLIFIFYVCLIYGGIGFTLIKRKKQLPNPKRTLIAFLFFLLIPFSLIIMLITTRIVITNDYIMKKNLFTETKVEWNQIKSYEISDKICLDSSKHSRNSNFIFKLKNGDIVEINGCYVRGNLTIEKFLKLNNPVTHTEF